MGSAFSAGEELGSHYQGFFCWVYFLSPFFPFFFFLFSRGGTKVGFFGLHLDEMA